MQVLPKRDGLAAEGLIFLFFQAPLPVRLLLQPLWRLLLFFRSLERHLPFFILLFFFVSVLFFRREEIKERSLFKIRIL